MSYSGYIATITSVYKTSYNMGTLLSVVPINNFTTLQPQGSYNYQPFYEIKNISIEKPDGTTINLNGDGDTVDLSVSGTYLLRYSGTNAFYSKDVATGKDVLHEETYSFHYTFSVVENHLPLKQWTITDVLNRLFDVCEPLRKGEKPRFKLNAEQAERFDKILAPQFSFTKQTLRECLQDVGKVVHGEPRLTPKKDADGWYYEVSYDMYAGTDRAGIYVRPYILKTASQVIDSYTSYLDSNAENLVNQLDKYSGVIVEPYAGCAKSVRTENLSKLDIQNRIRVLRDEINIPKIATAKERMEFLSKVMRGEKITAESF